MVQKPVKKSPKKKGATKRKPSKKHIITKRKKYLLFALKGAAIVFLFVVLFFFLVFFGVLGPVPSKQQLIQINNPVASEVYSIDGKVLGRYYVENRSNAKYNEISQNVFNALIATEDARFYSHRGVDEMALLRVLVKSILLQNKRSGGGSTLSQQIAKNLYPRVKYGPLTMPVNKLRESIIAYRLERIYSKEEVLTLYLNTVSFAENIFGIEVAAERFFSKTPMNLDVHEAAVIVGMLKANNYYNPRTHPERALKRRNLVISQMEKYDYLTAAQAAEFKLKPLDVKYRVITYNQGPAPYFLEKLKPQLLEWCENHTNEDDDPYNLYTDGLKITTTVDYNLQRYATQSVNEYMKNLQKVFDNDRGVKNVFEKYPEIIESAIRQSPTYNSSSESGKSYDEVLETYNKQISTTLFKWEGLDHTTISRLDSLKHYLKLLNTGFIAIEPSTGAIKAWIGGIDYRFFQYDHVTAPRQTGSTFKPFVFLAALEEGLDPEKYYTNKQKVYSDYQDWSPRNSHDHYGGYYSMQGALAKSINTVSVEVMMETGISNVIEVAEELGISADLPRFPSLALGVASISLQEMVEAYATIANGGVPVKTNYLLKIEDRNGNELETFEFIQETEPVVSPENCDVLVHMLKSVVDEGTGRGIRSVYKIKGDFAGKTGTTQNHADGWFIGMTPDLVVGCWVGADDPRVHFQSETYGQGAYMALPVVGKFFHKTYNDPGFTHLSNNKFNQLDGELLAQLNIPLYKEVLEVKKKKFDLAKIFSKKKDKQELEKVPDKVEVAKKKEKKPVWEKIKSIFKKKKK